ncbi:MAG: hypothetical protein NTX97_13530 [Bacteroidetes bacterium]|nr:hypothetical protein [Bacteroidota bacterium]
MKKTNIFLFLFFFTIVANGQVAGYMGKRFTIGYSNYFMAGFKGPGPVKSGPSDEASFTINNTHCFNLEYAHKQRRMVCLSGQYLRTGIAYDRGRSNGLLSSSSSDYPYPEGARYGGGFSKPVLLTSMNVGLGVKFFKSGFIAPTGRYRKLEVLMLFESVKYDKDNFRKSVNGDVSQDTLYTLGKGVYKFKNVSFVYSFGKECILNDKIVLDYGIRVALTPQFNIITLMAGDEFINSTEDYFRHQANMRITREQLVNFHIGIGFLAF